MEFSLFFFADNATGSDNYRLLLESARFADAHGLSAVWTPERHFHAFGGLYPNPAVTGAAVAAITDRIGIRAGSVVAPLHHPLRIAEEWSVVDNLSGGRAGLSFASGWHAADFVLRPENYADRKALTVETVDTVRRLWRGEEVEFTDGAGEIRPTRIFPAPVQPELPVWLTSAGSPETFRAAGGLGAGLLTHLLGQDPVALAGNISAYRQALPGGEPGQVALMLHTMLGPDRDRIRDQVREPFGDYLRSSADLILRAAATLLPPDVDITRLPERDRDFLIRHAFERYFSTAGLFGTVEDGVAIVDALRAIGVDEIACLIDFGVPPADVLDSLKYLIELRDRVS
ncbi:MupA/Atu3671 family FMN-dependent luciferase-like monooxygenase [Nocardia sp. BMG111209]|uniref:MupA/Atu3671 family FMN-dependent luciferase-like monooxygenase n=1 Tax=Nocardia sp. BMG111209 TaxID=1160137 RepID=UPI000372F9D7|nr:MupA/Atu3671 family FMN-dependent luciferase-like monooxygenase [Nocardia sp. BMG111209]